MLYWVTTLVLLVYLVLVWLLGRWLPLHGSDVWILRGVLAVLGIIGAAVAYFYVYKVKKAKQAFGRRRLPTRRDRRSGCVGAGSSPATEALHVGARD